MVKKKETENKKKKRVLMLNYEYPPLGGGAGNATYYLLREFSKYDDVEIDLVTSSTNNFRVERVYDNVKVHFLDIFKEGNFHYQSNKDLLTYSYKAYFYAKRLMKRREFDVCHAFFGIPCGFIAMQLKIPYIVSLRGSDVPGYNNRFGLMDKYFFRKLSKKVWKRAVNVVALSHDLVNLAGNTCKSREISVVYNGIDVSEFKPNSKILAKEKTFNILFVGRLIERKGLIYVLEALREIIKEYTNVKLFIAGEGPLFEKFENYIVGYKMQNNVVLLGRVNHQEIGKLYQKSHLFVLPSLNEALGNVTQEALASGLPIITTNTGATELLDDNGITVEKCSSEDIKDAILRYIEDDKLLKEHSKRSFEIAQKMSWENVAKKYFSLYKS